MRSLKAGTKDSTSKALLSVTMSFRSLSSMTFVRIEVMMIMMKTHHTLKNAKCKFVITYVPVQQLTAILDILVRVGYDATDRSEHLVEQRKNCFS